MRKTEMILELLRVYDELEALRNENEMLYMKLENKDKPSSNPFDYYDKEMLTIGKDKILRKSLSFFKTVKVYEDENGNKTPEKYKDWIDDVVINIPKFMSKDDFVVYFRKELQEIYEENLDIAMSEE